jgi:antitoxin (DNA-binding transcriptional repressor) of toxin-antitoxin stability system
VLDSAEHGETIVVTRAGKRVALIVPAPRANGAALRKVFGRWQGNAAFDDTFAANVATASEVVSAELDTDPWRG